MSLSAEECWDKCPMGWEGFTIVELDSCGDAGAWLKGIVGDCWDWIEDPEEFEELANCLADEYLLNAEEEYVPLPTEFMDAPSESDFREQREEVLTDFRVFLLEWGGRVQQRRDR